MSSNSSSQPTYEELKLMLAMIIIMDPMGSQPTYEELKPGKRI